MHPLSKHKNPFISFNNVSLRLAEHIVFQDTNWAFSDDEHWAVIGTNGSGKSILARALTGRIPAVQGRIVYHFLKDRSGRSWEGGASLKTAVSYVCFDQQKLAQARRDRIYQARWHSSENADTLSVSDYLSAARVYNINPFQIDAVRPDPEAFESDRDRVISTLGIQTLINKKIIQLSNGETRKVMLARALLTGPRLLILDNPFTGLDRDYRRRLTDILEKLMHDRLRVIIMTSRQDEILPAITHVMVVEDRQTVALGPKEKVLDQAAVRRMWQGFSSIDFNLRTPHQPGPRPDYGPGDVVVDMKDINISYNGVPVLRDIDWTIKKGQHWALAGPNGSGKTTLLSLIAGDNPRAYANDITLFGRRRGTGESLWEVKQKIGFISPELHLHFPRQITAFDAVCSGFFDSSGLYRRCSNAQRQMAGSWMENLGLIKYRDTLLDNLSDGTQRLILIARALVKQPLLLIMDEPCQGLDAGNRHRVLNLVDAIGNQLEVTIIFVTHDIDELPGIITHTLTLK